MTTWTDDENGGTVWSEDEAAGTALGAANGASLVGFTQSGSGAIPEDVQTVLQRTISLYSYIPLAIRAAVMADTDTTDLSTYIANAKAACEAAGLPLHTGPGTFNFSTAQVFDGVDIIGDGPDKTTLKFNGTGVALTINSTGSVNSSLTHKGFTLLGNTSVSGQDGLHIKGSMNGWAGGQIVVRNFDGFSCQIGVSGTTAAFFSNAGYIWCHAKDRTGTSGFIVDGGSAPNSNANVFHSIYVGGKYQTFFDIRSHGNTFIGGAAEFNQSSASITDVFKISGTRNRFIGTYIENTDGSTFPTRIVNFSSIAVGNSFTDVNLQMELPSGGFDKYVSDSGFGNSINGKCFGLNYPMPAGNISGANLLQNTQFLGSNGSPSISAAPWGWMTFGATAMTRDTGTTRGASASLKLTSTGTSQACFQYLYSSTANRARFNVLPKAAYLGRDMVVGCWVYSTTAGCGTIRAASAGTYGTSTSAAHSGSGAWEFLSTAIRVDSTDTTEVNFQARIETGITGDAYFSEPVFCFGTALPIYTPSPVFGDNANITGRMTLNQMTAFTDTDTTPDVSLGNQWEAANATATSLTTFDGGIQGQPLTVYFSTGATKLVNGATLALENGVDFSPAAGDVVHFVLHGTVWRETKRRTTVLKRRGVVEFFDDFLGDVLADQWNTVVGSDPQCVAAAIRASQPRGLIRMTTGDDAAATMAVNGTQLDSQTNWQANQGGLVFEVRMALDNVSNFPVFVGFTDQAGTLEMPFTLGASDTLTSNATDAVGILWDPRADTDQWCAVGVANDADATKQFLGTAASGATMVVWRVEVTSAGVASFYKDGLLVGTAMSSAVRTTIPLTPVVACFSVTTASRNLDVDYVLAQANR